MNSSGFGSDREHAHAPGGEDEEGEEGYEMRPLQSRGAEGEGEELLGGKTQDDEGDDDDDDAGDYSGGDEVLYAIDEGPDGHEPPLRSPRRRMRRREFLYTRAEERAVVRKLDKYLVGGLAVLYMLSFLDRSNIGNARIAGMKEDLDLSGDRYEWLLSAFYVTYILFQWCTLLWKVFPAHKYVACCVVGWGLVASLQALAVNWFSLVVLRAALGIFEAAFGPGVPFYLSLFYRREELALRTGLFISAAPLATAYAGFLAYAITSIPSSIAPWRLLFLLEGFPSLVAGICAYYFIPDSPADAGFLRRDQKKIARRRLLVVRDDEEDTGTVIATEERRGLRWKEVWRAFRDPGNWITALIFFFANVSFASLPVFLPTIINEMDLGVNTVSPAQAQALSIPPYIFGLCVILLTTYLSDRFRSRSVPLIILCITSISGYLLLVLSGLLHKSLTKLASDVADIESPGAWWEEKIPTSKFLATHSSTVVMSYVGIMLAAGTIFAIISLVITWNGNNSETESSRGAGMAILQGLGQCGPLLGTRLYPADQGPEYISGSLTCAGCMLVVCCLVGLQRWRLGRENRRREALDSREAAMEGDGTRRRVRRFLYML
ncbi:major facilitator superfamily domain-containing protein [Tricharina praecox]|uniref:major facilitator superfamily domain-containing protein n=1 Tax=Tricharina praecox TaxID=43433 RepID=UPI0022205B0B|nr:major facilitator superfamily domain-containing protein [Tricharina praecox]KAI5849188.1 major facilitator superfamily domain-containing protein [Tricharina praecox]